MVCKRRGYGKLNVKVGFVWRERVVGVQSVWGGVMFCD